MDAVGGVASVIAVITFALQSTKVIYEFTSSISHGSDDINRLATATSNLQKLLEDTKLLAEHADRTNSVADGNLLEKVKPLVDRCANDLGEISGKLSHIQKDSKDGRWKKAKKHAKVYLDTKGVKEIWNTVNHYVELLGSSFGNASVDVGLYNAEKLHLLHGEVSAASQVNKSQLSHVEDVLRDHRALAQASFGALLAEVQLGSLEARVATTTQIDGIAELNTRQQQFGRAAAIGYNNIAGIRTDIQEIKAIIDDKGHQAYVRSAEFMTEVQEGISKATTLSSAQNKNSRRVNANFFQELHSVCDRLDALPDIGREQLSSLQSLVSMLSDLQLEMRTQRQNSRPSAKMEASLTHHDRCINGETSHNLEVERILARVYHFAGKITTHTYSQGAQSAIEDLGRLLGLVMQQISATSPRRDELPRKRKTLCDYHYSNLETEVQSIENLGKAKRVLTSSDRVRTSSQDTEHIDKNEHSAMLPSDVFPKRLPTDIRQRRVPSVNLQTNLRSWTLVNGRLDAIFRTTVLPDAEDQDTESAEEAFAAKLLITPISGPISNFQIVIDVASKTYHDRTIYFTPMLTFRAVIPDDSEVFLVVRGGSVRKLKKLLDSGTASLGDCDSKGRSLLNFAIYKSRRKMTKFLIQSGADIDTLEPPNEKDCILYGNYDPVKPLYMFQGRLDRETSDEDLERVDGCYKQLLDAGTDISSVNKYDPDLDGAWESPFYLALYKGTLTKLKALIDLGKPFISLDSSGDNVPIESVPLLLLANLHSQAYGTNLQMPDKVGLLLTRGANVKARNSRGETCLHLVFEEHYPSGAFCWCDNRSQLWRHRCRTKDIVILMITAGADVCAVDEEGESVSDVAIRSGQQTLWTEALDYCGIDIRDVLARPNLDPAHSTALSPEYSQAPRSVTSTMSLKQYIERREAFRVPEEKEFSCMDPFLGSSEDDDSGDEDSESGDSPTEDDENMNEEWAEDASEASEADEQESDDANHEVPIQYESSRKTKLD